MVHYSGGYTKRDVQPVADLMMENVSSPITTESLFRKYASKRNLKVSIEMRTWAKQQVESGKFSLKTSSFSRKREAGGN